MEQIQAFTDEELTALMEASNTHESAGIVLQAVLVLLKVAPEALQVCSVSHALSPCSHPHNAFEVVGLLNWVFPSGGFTTHFRVRGEQRIFAASSSSRQVYIICADIMAQNRHSSSSK